MRSIFKILLPLLTLIILSCDDQQRHNFDKVLIPLSPVNFSEVNSAWDDYNPAFPFDYDVTETFVLIFSTNRINQGSDFDFISYDCRISEYLVDGEFYISANPLQSGLLDEVNSPYNELGPYLNFDFDKSYSTGNPNDREMRFFYSSDANGNYDIFWIYFLVDDSGYAPSGNPVELTGINTVFDEGYLTIHSGELPDRETVYFTSNRDNGYDIYRATSEENKTIDQSSTVAIEKVVQLSSDAEDKCPYIHDNLMVFTSDRPGGSGGFDLWLSVYNGTEWGVPENLGDKINTGYNEYRPVILKSEKDQFLNDMLIFSSDRPGGKGKYDLYYVGLTKVFE